MITFNDLLTQVPGVIVALTCIASEYLIARGKLSGWIWAIMSSLLAGLFFLFKGSNTLVLLELMYIPFCIYGFLKWRCSTEQVTKTDNIMTCSAVVVVIVYFFCGDSYGLKNFIESSTSGASLIGGLLITKKKRFGWHLSLAAEVLMGVALLRSSEYGFFVFQLISIGIPIKKLFFEERTITQASAAPQGSAFLIQLLRIGDDVRMSIMDK